MVLVVRVPRESRQAPARCRAGRARGQGRGLPPWAENSPSKFVAGMRSALEHSYTSLHLHDWLDLIFGRKQRGPLAVESANVFFYLCYGDQVDLDAIENPKLRAATVLKRRTSASAFPAPLDAAVAVPRAACACVEIHLRASHAT